MKPAVGESLLIYLELSPFKKGLRWQFQVKRSNLLRFDNSFI